MTYNTAPRRRFTQAQREVFLEAHGLRCYWCGELILTGQPWAIEHMIARELLPDTSADDLTNLAPIHAHPAKCHKIKTKRDAALIAKSNRIRRSNGPPDLRRKTPHPIRTRKTNWAKRSFPKRASK